MPITHFLKRSLITLPATMKAVVSIFIAALLASPCEASAPLFSAEACGTMYEKLVSLGVCWLRHAKHQHHCSQQKHAAPCTKNLSHWGGRCLQTIMWLGVMMCASR